MSGGVPAIALSCFFFFNDTATTEIYPLSLHDALPISAWNDPAAGRAGRSRPPPRRSRPSRGLPERTEDRKSTRLNSSHSQISYAVFCLKKKKPSSASPSLAAALL